MEPHELRLNADDHIFRIPLTPYLTLANPHPVHVDTIAMLKSYVSCAKKMDSQINNLSTLKEVDRVPSGIAQVKTEKFEIFGTYGRDLFVRFFF